MSTVTSKNVTNNQATFEYDVSKIFIWGNRYHSATFNNNTGGELAFAPGTVVARVAASGKIVAFNSTATDGSQIPIGVLKTNIDAIANAADVTDVNYCLSGDVAEEKLLFQGSDDLDTVVTINNGTPAETDNTRIVRDMLEAIGIRIIAGTELTAFDNA